jgi:hypothetical protein
VNAADVQKRTVRNAALGPYQLEGSARDAARRLFSWLADVEQIAVLAAERGDGIPQQLEDELSHRDGFALIAERLGGKEPMGRDVALLLAFLQGLRGAESLLALNVVAESWLENVFDHLAQTDLAPSLFRLVEAEEHRHCEEARALARPDGSCQELVSSLESLLYEVVRAPGVLVPLSFLIGPVACARMAISNVTRHLEACFSLGVQPSQKIRDLMTVSRAALLVGDREPEPTLMHEWDISRQRLWQEPAPMMAFEKMPAPREASLADLEAEVVRRCSLALAAHPQLNRVVAQGQMFRPLDIRVGVRRSWDLEGELITTVYVDNAHLKPATQVKAEIHRKADRYRRRPYEPAPDVSALRHLLPPARCPIVISQVGGFGIRGVGPLTQDEGAPISVFIGRKEVEAVWSEEAAEFRPRPVAHLWVVYDHRAGNGRELGLLVKILTEES